MQQVQDNPECIKIQDEVNELQDILSGRNTKTKYGGIGNEGKPGTVTYASGNPAADAAYADYEALQAKHKAEEEKRYAAMSKIKMFNVTLNPDGTAKSMDYTPQYEKALTAYNKFQSANRKEAGALYTSMKDIRTGQRGYKDIPSVDETRNRLKAELSQKMEQSIAIFDKNIYNALNPKIAGAGGSPGQPYTPPKEDPTNPYVPAPGRGTKLAASPDPGPAPVKPGDVPVVPSSPWLPGKAPKVARYKKPDYVPPYVQDWGSLGGGGRRTSPTGGDLKNWDPNAKIKASTQKDFGSIAQAYGGQGVDAATLASTAAATQTKKKKKDITPMNPNKWALQTASYKPRGSMITERRKLKSPNDWFNPDDIKPEYPKDPPPEMVNNYHPDLVDSAKKAERFNKLDPASAKAMPKQDDPNIDAKVEKAKNNPDKDGPGWHKQVSDKIRMARAQQRKG